MAVSRSFSISDGALVVFVSRQNWHDALFFVISVS